MTAQAIFLSASVPVPGRGIYHETADPFLIQFAVRELMTAALGRRLIVWGGHPAITPMVWAACEDLGVDYSRAVVLYQTSFFEDLYPDENKRFCNVEFVEKVPGDREASLLRMRESMLGRADLSDAVFIGGMEGVTAEYDLFTKYHPGANVLPVAAPGGAARELALRLGVGEKSMSRVDFSRMFHASLGIAPNESRSKVQLPHSKQ
jgi:hypothetical protein